MIILFGSYAKGHPREDSDVDPGGGLPPRVVVTLLWALQPAPVSVGVLARASLVVPAHTLVCRVEALVALRVLAQVVEREALVHAEATVRRRVRDRRVLGVGNGVRSIVLVARRDSVARGRDEVA